MSVPSATGGVDPHPDAPPVHALVAAHARRTPHRPAVVGDHPSVSYQQLWELTTRMLGQLSGHAVAGRAVALRLPPGATQVAATLAAWRAGAEVVCLDQGDPGDRGRDALTQVRPAVLLVEPATTDEFTDWFQAELGVVVEAVTLEASPSPPLLPTAELEPDLHRRACVTFTSGSTGRPKGIPQSHAALSQFLTWFAHEFRIGPGVRVAQWAAPSYDASLSEIFATLAAGGVLHPVPGQLRAHPEALARWLAQQRIHVFQTVPSFATELLKALRRTGIQLPDLQVLLLAGEPLSADLVHQLRHALPDTRLVNLYGPSEALLATWHDLTGPVPEQVPIGVPIPGREVLVVDDQDRPCPPGVTGEIVIRSQYLTSGYLGVDSDGHPAFRPLANPGVHLPTFRTGDLGRWRHDGRLEFQGRRDFQVKVHGIRLELTEIERLIATNLSVAECVVVPVRRPDGLLARLVAYVVGENGTTPDRGGLRALLRQRFGNAAPAVTFTVLDRLPRSPSGKVDRRRLAELAATGTSRRGGSGARNG